MFAELPEDRFEAFLSVPLVSQGRLVGVIDLQSRQARVDSEREIGLISTLGFMVGAEIGRTRLEARIPNSLPSWKYGKLWSAPREFCNTICVSAKKPRIRCCAVKASTGESP